MNDLTIDDFHNYVPDFFGFFTKRSIRYKVIFWFDCDLKESIQSYIDQIYKHIHYSSDYESLVSEGIFVGETGNILFVRFN